RNGEVLETDLVISAAGLKPNSTLAEKADLATNRGIIANKNTMQTSDPHIYAVGDCAEIEGRSYFYIEPIKRQAFSAAASIAGVPAPFELLPTAIRVKTSSLALNICPPDLSVIGFGGWTLIEEDGDACHMEFRVGGKLAGYALSGAFAARANELYQRLIEERRSAMAVA
ncbi:MAG: FAD-dependent oxidoreductase, partial [Gammaproteobacteria bacterium]|nr:FAD-dependent oxidoreductase [Gammaproteobacteria bacterium]